MLILLRVHDSLDMNQEAWVDLIRRINVYLDARNDIAMLAESYASPLDEDRSAYFTLAIEAEGSLKDLWKVLGDRIDQVSWSHLEMMDLPKQLSPS